MCIRDRLHTAETEKYAHVTFFFNGGRETPYEGEDRILVPSPKVATYDPVSYTHLDVYKRQVVHIQLLLFSHVAIVGDGL